MPVFKPNDQNTQWNNHFWAAGHRRLDHLTSGEPHFRLGSVSRPRTIFFVNFVVAKSNQNQVSVPHRAIVPPDRKPFCTCFLVGLAGFEISDSEIEVAVGVKVTCFDDGVLSF